MRTVTLETASQKHLRNCSEEVAERSVYVSILCGFGEGGNTWS